MNTFGWLLKREFWEHRGGFFWAPIVTGIVYLVLTVLGFVVAQATVHRSRIEINNLKLGELTEKLAEYLCARKGIDPAAAVPVSMEEYRREQLDILADGVRNSLDMDAVYRAMGMENPRGCKA